MPDDCGNHPAQRNQDVLLKIYEVNEPELRIAKSKLGKTIANRLRLCFIPTVTTEMTVMWPSAVES
jgi:hypothetical protein